MDMDGTLDALSSNGSHTLEPAEANGRRPAPVATKPSGTVATNVLVPRRHLEALRALARETRVQQSEYLREAIGDLLDKYLPRP